MNGGRASVAIDGDRLLAELEELAGFGGRPDGGVDRPAFSPAFVEASRWLVARMTEAGLAARIDAAGNVIGRLGPAGGPTVVCGSHIDTVPAGGRFDGSLGVLAGLECARRLKETGGSPRRALEVVAFADEEGAYFSLLGSRAMLGTLPVDGLAAARDRHGEPLADAMARCGLDLARIGEAARPANDFSAYIELHIEQGTTLESQGLAVGVVDAVVGIETVEFRLEGEARHAGTTPVDARRDAGRAACEAVAAAYAGFETAAGDDCRMTFGAMKFEPGASNVVPAVSRTICEVRAGAVDSMQETMRIARHAFLQAADRHRLAMDVERLGYDVPAPMSRSMIATISDACRQGGHAFTILPSGAGHDAQAFAPVVPTGMIFAASRDGISHHPDEFTAPDAVIAGADVLMRSILALLEQERVQ